MQHAALSQENTEKWCQAKVRHGAVRGIAWHLINDEGALPG